MTTRDELAAEPLPRYRDGYDEMHYDETGQWLDRDEVVAAVKALTGWPVFSDGDDGPSSSGNLIDRVKLLHLLGDDL